MLNTPKTIPAFVICLAAIFSFALCQPTLAFAQEDGDAEIQVRNAARQAVDAVKQAAQEEAKQVEDKNGEKKDDTKKEDEPLVEVTPTEQPEIGPREIRLNLWDGSIVRGNVGYSAVHIKTQFGRLEVPVENIVTMRPGLQSLPTIQKNISDLVEKLGDKEFRVREKAKFELAAMGVEILDFLKSATDGGSAERKKNLQAVIENITEQAGDASESAPQSTGPLAAEDSITTQTFTIVGIIEEKEFELTTPYGMLKIGLQNIKSGDRTWNQSADTIEKKLDVGATAFFQRSPTSTRIRVNAGDQITIRAEGKTNWASWGDVSSDPDGIGSHGNWNGFQCGKLVARIGKSGDYIGIGKKHTFVAKTSGELFLGVAMQDNFANQQGYQWNGEYKVTVRVESAGK